jgi:hypothetical protein
MRRRRVQPWVVAVLLAAALVATATASAHKPLSHTTSSAPRVCRSVQLTITVGWSFAGLGTAGANIRFRNHSSRPCSLHGWPTLTLQTPGPDAEQTHAQNWPGSSFADVTRNGVPTVILRPNQRADAIFEGPDGQTTSTPCGPAYRTLRVALPGDHQNTTLSGWIGYLDHFMPSCAQIHISPILPSTAVYKG